MAIRVPVADVVSRPDFARPANFARGGEVVREGSDVAILALGDAFPLGERVCEALEGRGVSPTLVNPRLATTPDEELLEGLGSRHGLVVTLEDGVVEGGFGERCARVLAERGDARVRCYGLPRAFLDRYDPEELLARRGMTVEGVVSDVMRDLGRA